MLQEKVGSASFITTPEGADIYINGTFQETKTSCIIDNIPIGRYLFDLKMNGYSNVSGYIDIKENQVTTIKVEMVPITENVGHVVVVSIPAGAMVYIDDVISESVTPMVMRDVLPGDHIIKIVLDGYEDYIEPVYVQPGEVLYITVELKKMYVEEPPIYGLFKPALMIVGAIGIIKLVSK